MSSFHIGQISSPDSARMSVIESGFTVAQSVTKVTCKGGQHCLHERKKFSFSNFERTPCIKTI